MTEKNKQLALKFLKAMGEGDKASAAECIADDTFTLAKGFGKFAGVRHHDTILATIASFKKLMPEGMKPDIHSVIAEGEKVAIEFTGNGKLINGEQYSNEYCMIFTIRDDRIRQVDEYFCTILADTVLFPLIAEEGLA